MKLLAKGVFILYILHRCREQGCFGYYYKVSMPLHTTVRVLCTYCTSIDNHLPTLCCVLLHIILTSVIA